MDKRTGIPADEVRAELMKDAAFRKEYEALEPEYELIRQIIRARVEQGLTQFDLAERIGTKQSNISRLEGGGYNPSLEFLQRVARGLGKELSVTIR